MLKKMSLLFCLVCFVTTCFAIPATAKAPDPSLKVATQTILGATPGYNKVRYEAALLIEEALETLGVDIDVKPVDFKVLMDIIKTEPWDYDAYVKGWGATADRIDPHNFLYGMLSSMSIKNKGLNRTGHSNPEYDKVVEAAAGTMDLEARRKLVFQAQEMLAEDVGIYILYNDIIHMPYNNERLEGVVMQGGIGINNPETYVNVKILTGENILKVAQHAPNEDLNTFSTSIYSDRQVLDLIYDYLVRLDKDNRPYPSAAESWEIVDDKTVQVRLKANQTFHDGHPLTAADVKFTFDYSLNHGLVKADAFIRNIDSIETPDDLTVVFHLKKPTGYFINATLMIVPILPKHIWENIEKPHETTVTAPIGSGPFKFNYWRRGEELRVDAYKNYHNPANIDAIIFKAYQSVDSVFGAMETRETDMYIEYLEPTQIEQSQNLKHITLAKTVGISFDMLGVNQRRKPWSDLAFRKAVAHVIDCNLIAEVVYAGYGSAAGAGRIISPANVYWHNPNVKEYETSLEIAQKILRDAGYQWDSKGKLYYPE